MSRVAVAVIGIVVAGLAGCGERTQTINAKRIGVPAYQGTGSASYTVDGWKPGDDASWRQQIDRRMQNQNEYNRVASS